MNAEMAREPHIHLFMSFGGELYTDTLFPVGLTSTWKTSAAEARKPAKKAPMQWMY